METTPHGKFLELKVSNFGPIVEAEIELRPLTVFVGPSNTGKSYLAILIYALHKFLSTGFSGQGIGDRLMFRSPPFPSSLRSELTLSDSELSTLLRWARDNASKPRGRRASDPGKIEVPDEVAARVRPMFGQMDGYAEQFDTEIKRCFGVDEMRQLIRRPRTEGAHAALRRRVDSGAGETVPFEFTFSTRGAKPTFSSSIPHGVPLYVPGNSNSFFWTMQRMAESLAGTEDESLRQSLLFNLFDIIFMYSVGEVNMPAYYLPADRTGVMHAHRVVVRSLIERATAAGLRPATPTPALSGVMADFLEQLIRFDDAPRKGRNDNQDLVRRLEEEVLTGSIHMERSEVQYPRFYYTPRDWKEGETLPLMNASSMISELAPVVLYLRHVVDAGDLLIIEEPESHLHPAMQVAFIRNLAEAVRAGIRVLITTHSEWVLEEVANLVSLSRLPKERRKGLENAGVFLPESVVGAWRFKTWKRPKGSKVEEIRLDKESGTFPSGFSHVSEALYNKWAEITNRIEESRVQ